MKKLAIAALIAMYGIGFLEMLVWLLSQSHFGLFKNLASY